MGLEWGVVAILFLHAAPYIFLFVLLALMVHCHESADL